MMRRYRLAPAMVTLALVVGCGATDTRDAARSSVRPGAGDDRATKRDQSWRFTPPASSGPSTFTPPAASELRLTSGIRVIVVENHASPLVALRVIAPLGTADVPAGKAGLAYLLVQMLAEGTLTRDSSTFGRDLAVLGATLSPDVGFDGSFVTVETLVENLDPTLDLLAEVLRSPRLDRPTFAKVRAQATSQARAELAEGLGAGLLAVRRGFLGGKVAAAHPAMGDEAGLARIRLSDVIAFHRTAFNPRTLTVVVAGDVTAADVGARLEARLGDWTPARGVARVPSARAEGRLPAAGGGRVLLVDRPDAPRVDLVLGIDGIDRRSPDWSALEVMNNAFGGMYGSRVNLLLRETKGYTYAFRSSLRYSHRFGHLIMRSSVKPDVALDSIDSIIGEMRRLLNDPPRPEEMERARRVELSRKARSFITNAGTAAAFDDIVLHGLPLDSWTDRLAAITSVSVDDVQRVARTLLAEDRLIIAMVGPVAGLGDQLASRGLRVEKLDVD